MKIKLFAFLLLLLIFAGVSYAQSNAPGAFGPTLGGSGSSSPSPGVFNSSFDPPLFQNYSLTTTGAQAAINLTANPIDTHTISWRPSGTVSTCTVALDTSPDGTTWTAGGAIPGQTCTSAGEFASLPINSNYVRVNLTTLTGGGTLTVVYSGRLAPAPVLGTPVSNAIYVNAGEAVILNTSGNFTAIDHSLAARLQGPTGVITSSYTHASLTGSANLGQGTTMPYIAFATPGWLQFVDASVNATGVSTGETFLQIFLGCTNLGLSGSGTISAATFNTCANPVVLAGGNASSFQHITWPTVAPSVTNNAGYPITTSIANPGAGNPGAYTPSTLNRHLVTAVTFRLTTSATVINRFAQLSVTCGGNLSYVIQSTLAQPAGTAYIYSFITGVAPVFGNGQTIQVFPLPSTGLEFSSGDPCGAGTINMTASSLQAGDAIDIIVVREKIWEESN